MTKKIKKALKSSFGYTDFKENQEEIIKAVLEGRDVFAAMPTGGGKSLCYQLPALLFEGITVVVSPLIALMKDQVDDAGENGIPSAYINSSMSREEYFDIQRKLENNELKLLYIAPERFTSGGFLEKLKTFNVSCFAVDEAHCISEWGHEFRPDYYSLSLLREQFPSVPISAFTATATKKVQEDIISRLNLENPFIIRSSFNRKELYYRITPKTNANQQILDFIKKYPDQSGIVYRNTRKDVEGTAEYLMKHGISSLPYHAGLSPKERKHHQELFKNDEVRVITATIAFGMGIDKSNIRFVIHGDLPKSIESYYQETGRAGRDGELSHCLLLYSRGDTGKIHFHIRNIEDEEEQNRARKNLSKMVSYAETGVCRRKQLLSYFDESYPGNCGMCDSCNDEIEMIDGTVDAQKILSSVKRLNEGFGANYVIDVVRGADTERIRQKRHNLLPTYGVGKDKSKEYWYSIVNELLSNDSLFKDDDNYSVLKITDKGMQILFGRDTLYVAKRQSTKKSKVEVEYEKGDDELFKVLSLLRREIAKKKGIAPYMVFSDKSLREMSVKFPETGSEFLEINGVGQVKLEAFGDAFISCIKTYISDRASVK